MVKTYVHNGGTPTATSTWTSSGTTFNSGGGFPTFNDIYNRKNSSKPKIKVRNLPKRDFWDGVEWKEFKTYMPHKSITGKIIVGKMYRRTKTVLKKYGSTHKQYAKTKELFTAKLKGEA